MVYEDEKERAVRGVLHRVRTTLSDPTRWTKGYMARGEDGWRRDPLSPDATCQDPEVLALLDAAIARVGDGD